MLEDLHEYIEEIVRNFDASLYAEDRELPNEFKNYILDHPDGKSYVFNKFTTIIHTDLDIYSPNQWFYIAAYYCKIYPLLQKYRELSIQALCKGLDQTAQKDLFSKASSRHDEIFAAFDIAGYDSDTKEKLWNFVSDYNWWRGGKGIERNDFYYSPILSAAQLVNQSQSYVAEICKYLISNPDALTILNEGIGSSVISQTQLFEETNIAKFMGQCMEEFLNYDSNISQADKYLQKNAVTVGFKKCPFGYLKSKADSETDPRRFDDCNKNITWYFNGQVYYFWKEQSSEKLEIFKNTFNIIYKTIYYIDINGGIYRLYKISKSKIANKLSFSPLDEPLQKIVYGAPGTGKSHGTDDKIKEVYPDKEAEKDHVFRTTFHPDSDYSTFVGCYKPTMIRTSRVSGYIDDSVTAEEKNQLTYEFVPQSFTKAYVEAWKNLLKPISVSGTTTSSSVPVLPAMPSSDNSSPFGDCAMMTPQRTEFKYELEGYTTTPLKTEDEDLLKQIDSLEFPFDGYDSLGALHDVTTVVLSDAEPTMKVRKSRKDLEQLLDKLMETEQDLDFWGKVSNLRGSIQEKLNNSNDEYLDFDNPLLGEYKDGKVYLYVEAIKKAASNSDFPKLLAAVYVHEMMHAYFKTNPVIEEVEEAIVECCTLSFLEKFDAATSKILLDYYKRKVASKIYAGLGHYAFGAFLYEHQLLNWMAMYKNAHVDSNAASKYVNQFAQIYPFGEEEKNMQMLYALLNGIKSKTIASTDKSFGLVNPVFLVIEEINRGNCAQIFGDLFQLLDRKGGFSEYPIKPDTDLGNYLREEFKKAGLTSDKYKAVVDGEELLLPNNLYIWATMNTSDQSLFPIDSAFKRRWDWEYRPINHEAQSGWKIEADKPYSWSSFLEKINKEIEDTTSSEDKQLGFFFCKAENTDEDGNNGTISAEKFVSKVLFYLYNDVFKDYGFDREFFKHKDGENKGKIITFRNLYQMDGKINKEIVAELLNNLGVEEIKSTSNEDDQNFDSDTIDAGMKEHKETLVAVTIDGERLTADGTTQFDLYLSAIKKLGIARIAPVIESMKYRRKGSPMATKTQVQGVLDSSDYSYVEAEGYHFVKGANGYTLIRILEDLNENLSLNIKVEYK